MVAFASRHTCRRKTLLAHFGEHLDDANCGACDVCTGDHESIDITREAQMVLSAITRTGERFGIIHVINIVWGADTRQIREFGHDKLKTYGIGHQTSKQQWREIIDTMLGQGVCMLSDSQYPSLQLAPTARDILEGKATIAMTRKKAPPVQSSASSQTVHGNHPELFELLRQKRRQIAEERAVPPYIIFSDRTLHDMAHKMPRTTHEMLAVNGIGEVKLAQYGERFLDVITTFRTSP
jgi:ATP-dependent DNA helicase RecQ